MTMQLLAELFLFPSLRLDVDINGPSAHSLTDRQHQKPFGTFVMRVAPPHASLCILNSLLAAYITYIIAGLYEIW